MPARPATFDVLDVVDGSLVGTFDETDADAVQRLVSVARAEADAWSRLGLAQRTAALRSWRSRLWRRSSELAGLLHRESGIGLDAALTEVLRVVEHLRWVETHLDGVLGTRSVGAGPLAPDLAGRTSYLPEGVVGVVTAGRSSFYAAASAVVCALAAGNTVVLRPGELTATLSAYAESFGRASSQRLVVVTGGDDTALALAGSPLDRLCFLGPPVAGVRLGTAAARALVPFTSVAVVPPITVVAPDADLASAALAVARTGSGEGDEHEVYVAPDVRADFEDALAAVLAPPASATSLLARAIGRRREAAPAALPGPVRPTVRVHTAPAFDVLVDRLRQHPSAQVAIHSRAHGARLAELLGAAEVSVNLAGTTPGTLPRSAVGARGYGPFAGEDGLRTFVRARTTTARRRLPLPLPLAPAEALLSTPPGRLATRIALNVRHTLG